MAGKGSKRSKSGRRSREPLKINMSFNVRTGEDHDDVIKIMDNRELRMAGSVFQYRDRMARFLALTLWRVAVLHPSAYREVLPGVVQFIADKLRPGADRPEQEDSDR